MAQFIKLLIIALASGLAIKCNEYLIKQNMGLLLSVVLSSILAVTFTKISEFILLSLPLRIKPFRYLLDPRAKYEGVWILTLIDFDARPYSYATIEYNSNANEYIYYGSGFNSCGQIKSQWHSVDLSIDIESHEVRFFAEGQINDSDGEFFKNWGRISFEKESFGKKFTRGKGFFVDFGTNFTKGHFLLERLTKKQIKDLIGKPCIQSHNDMAELIKKYHSAINGS